ncbi:FtsX-like permease family protein [Halegenticoccus tardaugens]|uniref:FtsX-like permease family protein n=1 Tax=Halegenticoccus tardaugens TaxID=2071624 RepID=UPI00100B96F9|nr:FtsX-like permease family protein [Halegenticoccus tardaugens]
MGYRRSILFRWSRRDRLAVLVIAATVAFLTGTTLVVFAAGAQTSEIAEEYDSDRTVTRYSSVDKARAAVGSDGLVLPFARVAFEDGTTRTVVGVPGDPPPDLTSDERVRFPEPPPEGLSGGDVTTSRTRQVAGADATERVRIVPRDGESVIDPSWYVASVDTVDRLGVTGAFVIHGSAAESAVAESGVPFVSALPFFVAGATQLVGLLRLATIAGGVLVVVTVYSVTRMMVRDRLRTIRVLRATGASPRRILALFAGRAALLSLVGVAIGYATGAILTRAAVNLALFGGLPTSLNVQVTAETLTVLAPAIVGLVLSGALAGLVAALSVARCEPGVVSALSHPSRNDGVLGLIPAFLRHRFGTRLLDWRALVPTTATLTVFVTFTLLVATIGGLAAPLTASEGVTITEPGASHPVASKVPESTAQALRADGRPASPEILLFEVSGGEPFLARGVDYPAYASLSDIELVRGRPPAAADEAVVGADLATTLGLEVGDTATLGGSTNPGFTEVTVVGTFDAPGPTDDQLLVSLRTARHLSMAESGTVQFVRTTESPSTVSSDDDASTISVVDVSPVRRAENGSATVSVTAENVGLERSERTVPVSLGDRREQIRLTLGAGERTTENVSFGDVEPGTYALAAGNVRRNVSVSSADAVRIERLPSTAPPGSTPRLLVTDASGPVTNATVSVDDRTATTGADGVAQLSLPETPGNYTVSARANDRTASEEIRVSESADRRFEASLRVEPSAPTVITVPEAAVELTNPWNETLTQQVRIEGPGGVSRAVTLDPGETRQFTAGLARRPAGTYTVSVIVNDEEIVNSEYTVRGDDRLGSAVASSGRETGGTGLGQGIETAFGNIRLLLVVVISLTGLMTVGGTTATFAQAVHAQRRTVGIQRATGATPAAVVRTVLLDAFKIGTVATGLALVLSVGLTTALLSAGRLTLFGVTLRPAFSAPLLAAVAAGALALAVLSAGLAGASLFKHAPSSLLRGTRQRPALNHSSERADDRPHR